MKKPFRILTSDILIADIVKDVEQNARLKAYADEHGMEAGDKTILTQRQFNEMSPLVMRGHTFATPGGSSANVVTTLSRLMGDDVAIDFIGRVGQGPYSAMINDEMADAKINMVRPPIPEGVQLQTATTYALRMKDAKGEKDKHNATYPGNVHEIIKPETAREDLVQKADAVFMQGSLWQKFDREFSNRLLKHRWQHKKELWLALPTKAEFGIDNKDLFQFIIPSSNVVLGNMDELGRVAGMLGPKGKADHFSPEQRRQALQKIQDAFNAPFKDEDQMVNKRNQRAFITDGSRDAWVVTADEIKAIPVAKVPEHEVKNKTGVGDTAFAGFLFGYLKGLNAQQSAQIGVRLAEEKIKQDDSRLLNPREVLAELMPHLAHQANTDTPALQIRP